jgi:phosphoenolpyruvate synthase/pyruvate phosphate dikinase
MKKLCIIHGGAASLGVATGRAVVIKHAGDITKVKDNEIIISRKASPELSIVFGRANAIVTENGGQSSNVMQIARTYGIPAVVGISGLTEMISDGDLVRVDGTNGTVEIKERNAA